MGSYKHIEHAIAGFIAGNYKNAIEVGIGGNTVAADLLASNGILFRCTDIRALNLPPQLRFSCDDIFEPDPDLYQGADVIYAIRPAVEMIPPLISIARAVHSDLVVCHLGFEVFERGGEKICADGVVLHRYVRGSESVKKG